MTEETAGKGAEPEIAPEEKRIEARVDGEQIAHRTLSPDEAKELAAKAYARGQAAANEKHKQQAPVASAAPVAPAAPAESSTPAGEPDPRRNQGSVVAFVAIGVVVLIVIAGFAILMWRLSKSESGIKTYLLEHL